MASFDAAAWATIIPSLVAGGIGLLGVFVGAWFSRRGQHEHWLRQERQKLYSEYLSLSYSIVRTLSVGVEPAGTKDGRSVEATIRAHWHRFDEVFAGITLIGDKETTEAARQLARLMAKVVEAPLRTIGDTPNDKRQMLADVRKIIDRFRASAAKDLGA